MRAFDDGEEGRGLLLGEVVLAGEVNGVEVEVDEDLRLEVIFVVTQLEDGRQLSVWDAIGHQLIRGTTPDR